MKTTPAPKFRTDWTTPHTEIWRRVLAPFVGRPGLNYLEVGVWEGRTLLWMMENLLTDPTSQATCIDKEFLPELFHNLRAKGAEARVELFRGDSRRVLKQLPEGSFDVIYVDGSHWAKVVMSDAVLSWELLRSGGVLIFDDYLLAASDALPIDQKPKVALDAFLTAYGNELEVVHRGYQLIVEKKICPAFDDRTDHYSRLGQFYYSWNVHGAFFGEMAARRGLFEMKAGKRVRVLISKAEEEEIRRLLIGKEFGMSCALSDEALQQNELYRHIAERHFLKD